MATSGPSKTSEVRLLPCELRRHRCRRLRVRSRVRHTLRFLRGRVARPAWPPARPREQGAGVRSRPSSLLLIRKHALRLLVDLAKPELCGGCQQSHPHLQKTEGRGDRSARMLRALRTVPSGSAPAVGVRQCCCRFFVPAGSFSTVPHTLVHQAAKSTPLCSITCALFWTYGGGAPLVQSKALRAISCPLPEFRISQISLPDISSVLCSGETDA
jgi:hypothetical protein